MKITEYKLTITYDDAEHQSIKEIIYRGNENILFREHIDGFDDTSMRIPRHMLDQFMKMIKYE